MTLTDSSCVSSNLEPAVPSISVGYATYLADLISGNNPPTSISLAMNSPCSLSTTVSYSTIFHGSSKLAIGATYSSSAFTGGWATGVSQIGFKSPLMEQWSSHTWTKSNVFGYSSANAKTADGTEGNFAADTHGHATCVNLRAEVGASAQERTMIEITHCCGTLDYRTVGSGGNTIDSVAGYSKKDHDMTCLTIKGMIEIFCEYIKGGIVKPGINLGFGNGNMAVESERLAAHPFFYQMWREVIYPLYPGQYWKYLTFDMLMSYDNCMDYRRWEKPTMLYSFATTAAATSISSSNTDTSGVYASGSSYSTSKSCNADIPFACGFGLFTPTAADITPSTASTGHNLYASSRLYDKLGGSDVRVDGQFITKASAAAAMNSLCRFMNAVVRTATGTDSTLGGDNEGNDGSGSAWGNYDIDTGYDFECCQCYISILPETGHTDDVQLGAFGANDQYNEPITVRRRLGNSDETTTPLERFELREHVRRQREKHDAELSVEEACGLCGSDGDWIEDACANPTTAMHTCPLGAARLLASANTTSDAPIAVKSAAVCGLLDPAVEKTTGRRHPCCLCHAEDVVSSHRRLSAEPLEPLPVDPMRARRQLLAEMSHSERRKLRVADTMANMACFPAAATATLADGTTKPMRDLQLGDEVLGGDGSYSPVYFFSHADAAVEASFVRLELAASGKVLTLSPDHYVPIDGILIYAKDVRAGDAISRWTGGGFETDVVANKTKIVADGLYNPYTLSGSIVVDGVLASCHSSWILDGLAVPRVAAAAYQRLFVVPRVAYALLGPEGMDAVFGVGNTGATASIAAQSAALAAVAAALALGASKVVAAAF